MAQQGELIFGEGEEPEGHSKWLATLDEANAAIGRKLGLPLGHEVEIWLRGGVRLRGRLTLREPRLFVADDEIPGLQFRIGRTPFTYGEMESCLRLD